MKKVNVINPLSGIITHSVDFEQLVKFSSFVPQNRRGKWLASAIAAFRNNNSESLGLLLLNA